MIAPQNMPETVDEFASLLNLKLDQQFTLLERDPGLSSI